MRKNFSTIRPLEEIGNGSSHRRQWNIVTSAVTGLRNFILPMVRPVPVRPTNARLVGNDEEGSNAGGGIVHMAAADISPIESQPCLSGSGQLFEIYNEKSGFAHERQPSLADSRRSALGFFESEEDDGS
jgi:hypothetical protein